MNSIERRAAFADRIGGPMIPFTVFRKLSDKTFEISVKKTTEGINIAAFSESTDPFDKRIYAAYGRVIKQIQ